MPYQRNGKLIKCPRCKCQVIGQPRWVRFKNGTVHLVWWCCGKQVGGPIPQREAAQYGLESYGQAYARLTLAQDQAWPSLNFED